MVPAPHSPRRQKLNLRMKSLSLDSPESTEHCQRRRVVTSHSGQGSAQASSHSSSSRLQCMSHSVTQYHSPNKHHYIYIYDCWVTAWDFIYLYLFQTLSAMMPIYGINIILIYTLIELNFNYKPLQHSDKLSTNDWSTLFEYINMIWSNICILTLKFLVYLSK